MNICFISSCIPKARAGGVDRVINNLFDGLSSREYNISCCYVFRDSEHGHINGLECVRFPDNTILDTPENIDFLVRHIRENKVDVLLCESFHNAVWEICVKTKKVTGVKLVYHLHNMPYAAVSAVNDRFKTIQLKHSGLDRWIKLGWNYFKLPYTYYSRFKYIHKRFKHIYADCDLFVLLSDYFIPELKKIVNDDVKLRAVNNPILISDSISVEKQKSILFVGRAIIDQKRPDKMLEIWQLLYKKHPDWSLIMAGDGPDLECLKEYANRLKLQNVSFVGQVDSIQYFAQSWISCLTSSYEGFGMVLVEAQQNGCIPIAYDSYESLRDIIDDGENGYIIPAFNKKIFAKRISTLIDDIELRERISANCRESADKFNIDRIVDEWEVLFKLL